MAVLQSIALSCNLSFFFRVGSVCGDDCIVGGGSVASAGSLGGSVGAVVCGFITVGLFDNNASFCARIVSLLLWKTS